MHHSSTSTYIANFVEIKETFCGRTDVRTDGHLRPTVLGQLGGVDLIIELGFVVAVLVSKGFYLTATVCAFMISSGGNIDLLMFLLSSNLVSINALRNCLVSPDPIACLLLQQSLP